MKRIPRIAAVAICSVCVASSSYAQNGASVRVDPQVEGGHQIYQISGTGFPSDSQVNIRAVNRRTDQGVTLSAKAASTGEFSNVFLGKDADGNYYVVAPGTWNVRAKSGTVVAKTTFASPRRPAGGQYGGSEAELRVDETGAEITLACADGHALEPLLLDDNGHFSVHAVLQEMRGPVSGEERDALLEGQVVGHVITFSVSIIIGDAVQDTFGPFDVVLDRKATFPHCV